MSGQISIEEFIDCQKSKFSYETNKSFHCKYLKAKKSFNVWNCECLLNGNTWNVEPNENEKEYETCLRAHKCICEKSSCVNCSCDNRYCYVCQYGFD